MKINQLKLLVTANASTSSVFSLAKHWWIWLLIEIQSCKTQTSTLKRQTTLKKSWLLWWPTKIARSSTSVKTGWKNVSLHIQRQVISKKRLSLQWLSIKIRLQRQQFGLRERCLIFKAWSTLWEEERLSWKLNSRQKARSVTTKRSLRSSALVKLRSSLSSSRNLAKNKAFLLSRQASNKQTLTLRSTANLSTSLRSTRASSQLTSSRRTRSTSTPRCCTRCQSGQSPTHTWQLSWATKSLNSRRNESLSSN